MAERVEIISGDHRRREWSDEDKLQFVAEIYRPGASVSAAARRHDLSPRLLFTWRQLAQKRPREADPVAMLPVRVSAGPSWCSTRAGRARW